MPWKATGLGHGAYRSEMSGPRSAIDPVVVPPEVGDLLHHRGRTRDQPGTVAGVGPLGVVPCRLVEPGRGLAFTEDRLQGILDHDQFHAVDDPDRPPTDPLVLVLLLLDLTQQGIEP